MALPVNIGDLVNGRTVEWERLEFKKGWNPLQVLHTICAFANDFNNWGGGYIIIGVEERNHRPVFPPKGLSQSELNKIQKDLLKLCHRLHPNHFVIAEPTEIEGKMVLIIWVLGGDHRPYNAPQALAKGSAYSYYIRRFNNTVKASRDEEKELLSLAAKIPFDDRIHHQSDIADLKLPLMQDYLKEVHSELYQTSGKIPFKQLCHQMGIIAGPQEHLKPRKVGLMLFNDHPEKIFPQAQIEVVIFHDGVAGDDMTEKIFEGPMQYQIRNALTFIQNSIIQEHIHKVPYQAEAIRFFNYPYIAIEEGIVNAMYHRDYEIREPVEVRINEDRIEILSFPGPDRSIKMEDLKKGCFVARRYRNRRIGEFFKELDLTEGRSTGIPKIIRVMKNNGSPAPVFKTDDDHSYFLTILTIHPKFIQKEARGGEKLQSESGAESGAESEAESVLVIKMLSDVDLSMQEIAKALDKETITGALKRTVRNLRNDGLIEHTIPEKPNSRLQKYRLTKKGMTYA